MVIDGKSILLLIGLLNKVQQVYGRTKMPLVIDLGKATFSDKLTYVIFECICHYFIEYCHRCVYLQYSISSSEIWTDGINSSPLLILGSHDRIHVEKFLKKFEFDLYGNHYRRVVGCDDLLILSKVMTEIESFLQAFMTDDIYRDKISEVIVELIGNASEHTSSECLIDIDVSNSYVNVNSGKSVYGVNIVVLNFSKQNFGNAIKEKLVSDEVRHNKEKTRYNIVLDAYKNHKNFFDLHYTEEDFYNIASFQHKISGREGAIAYGGTGLTKLIKALEQRSDAHMCYMLTGNRIVKFLHEHLEYDKNSWISFNYDKSFVDTIPAAETIDGCPVYFPGTAYNLNFVMEKRSL